MFVSSVFKFPHYYNVLVLPLEEWRCVPMMLLTMPCICNTALSNDSHDYSINKYNNNFTVQSRQSM